MTAPHKARRTGFTLVELLVAIALLGVLTVLLWRGLAHVIAQREYIDRQSEEIGRLVRVLAQLERDVAQLAPDVVVPLGGQPAAASPRALEIFAPPGGNAQLAILRTAPDAAGAVRLQRVRYFVLAGALMREASPPGIAWPLAPPSTPLRLIDAVQRLSVRRLTLAAPQDAASAAVAGENARVTGIEVTLERTDGARYVRTLVL